MSSANLLLLKFHAFHDLHASTFMDIVRYIAASVDDRTPAERSTPPPASSTAVPSADSSATATTTTAPATVESSTTAVAPTTVESSTSTAAPEKQPHLVGDGIRPLPKSRYASISA